jgi:general secretion pathway protein D
MKIVTAVILALLSASSMAGPVSFDFQAVPVSVFAQATYKAILNRDYVLSPELVGTDRKITVNVKNVASDRVGDFVQNVLAQQGIGATVSDGVYYLAPVKSTPVVAVDVGANDARSQAVQASPVAPSNEFDVYMPVNRSSDFLSAVVVAAFGDRSAVAAGAKVVITGTAESLPKMRALLGAVDAMPRLVDVSASWIEVTDTNVSGRGISVIANVLGARFGAQIGSVSSTSAISLRNTNFEVVINALSTDNRFKQISNSRVVGDDYERLLLIVGDETPTVSSTGKDNAGNLVQNVAYRPSGVIVDVLPKVLGNGRIRLAVDGQISNFKATTTGVASSPTLIKRQVKTTVTVTDGEVLLIGGLNDSQKTDSTATMPFIPASWWSGKSNNGTQSDLVLVLSAKVAASEKQ